MALGALTLSVFAIALALLGTAPFAAILCFPALFLGLLAFCFAIATLVRAGVRKSRGIAPPPNDPGTKPAVQALVVALLALFWAGIRGVMGGFVI